MAKKSAPIVRNLEREAEAAKNLVAHMATILGEETQDDSGENEALHRDMIEGETNLLRCIDKAVEFIAMDGAHIEALKVMISKIEDRKKRKAMRIDTVKAAIKVALDMAGLDRHEGAMATIGVGLNPIKLFVTEESQIPSKFFEEVPVETPPPVLKEKDLLAYLKTRKEKLEMLGDVPDAERPAVAALIETEFPAIQGAELSNQDTRLNIRFK